MLRYSLFLLLFGLISIQCSAQSLSERIKTLTEGKPLTLGVSAIGIENSLQFHWNENKALPMQSVFKFPIAIKVLSLVDKGTYSLTSPILVKAEELLDNTWSPLKVKYPTGDVTLSLGELIEYAVAQSDNNACDVLLRLGGGPLQTQKFIRSFGLKEFQILFNEEQMHEDWERQYQNAASAKELSSLLKLFYEGKTLSESSTAFLYKVMLNTKTGSNKMKALLPKGSTAHKTGASGKNKEGLTGAENDIGIVTTPKNNHYALSILISDSKLDDKTNTQMIATISKWIYDYYVEQE
ncbi:class A beta-lactamase, subclass A2 [Chryseobacterium sp. A321]